MNEKQASIGTVYMNNVEIVPGNNTFNAVMQMKNPDHPELIDQMVSIYMTDSQAALTVQGTTSSTNIESLQEGLSTVHLATEMHGINSNLVQKTEVEADASVVLTHQAQTWVTLNNPLKTPYTVKKVQVDITNPNNGNPYKMGTIDYELPNPISVPAGGQVRTDAWPVQVDANAVELLGLVGHGEITIDLQQNVTAMVGDTDGGYPVYFYYYQNNVPCMLDIKALGISLPNDKGFTESGNNASTSTSTASSPSSSSSNHVLLPL